jgi:hypothetical protein
MKHAIAALLGVWLLFSGVSVAQAGGLDLSLSNETALLEVQLAPGMRFMPNQGGGAEVSIGLFTNEPGDNLVFATLLARGVRQSNTGQYNLGAGVKLIGGDLDISESVGALALGFQASILLASSTYNPVDFVVEGFYAPSISSFSDAESFTELGARLQVEIIPQARAFVGYRRMLFDTNDYPELSIDRSVHVGLSLRF